MFYQCLYVYVCALIKEVKLYMLKYCFFFINLQKIHNLNMQLHTRLAHVRIYKEK